MALGGALGSMGRYWLGARIARSIDTFPLGTMIINIIGSFVI
ncbi:CrcB family protein, partial [Acinetobacter baumannii]